MGQGQLDGILKGPLGPVEASRMAWKRALAQAAHWGGLFPAAGALYGGRRLTVLAYHRVADHQAPGFDTYRRNVSAAPEEFSRQMDYVAEHFHPVSLGRVAAALDGGPGLPRRALLVTFDDGYRDNLQAAWPILQARGIPMTLFLATDFVGGACAFPWDFAAWCFQYTARGAADLPVVGERMWATGEERERVLGSWLETLKRLPDAQREAIVLHHLEQKSLEEIGGQMDRTAAAVAGLIKRGLRTLRLRLQEPG